MNSNWRPGSALALKAAATVAAVAALIGTAFAAWIDNGPQMLMALAASGMAWCF